MLIVRRFGADAWAAFYRDIAGTHTCFQSFVTAETFLPLPVYLAFHDELMRHFYSDDEQAHVELGRESARWALTEGPQRTFMSRHHANLVEFAGSFSKLWRTHFADTTSRADAAVKGDVVEFDVSGLPQWHPYLEHCIVGYHTEMLEMFCANPIRATRTGGDASSYHYLLHPTTFSLDDSIQREAPQSAELAVLRANPHLSNREVEVLMLVADGKTNQEIGIVLGISGKTAQHTVARVYRKIGVSSRVGATVWLAQRGKLGA